jgi:hypothetical protein
MKRLKRWLIKYILDEIKENGVIIGDYEITGTDGIRIRKV